MSASVQAPPNAIWPRLPTRLGGAIVFFGLSCVSQASPPVATVAGREISQQEVSILAAKEALDLADGTQRTNAVRQAITFATFAEEAKAQGYLNRPEVLAAAERLAVDLFIREKVDPEVGAALNTEPELRAYYDAHLDEFGKPATAKLRLIEVYVDPENPGIASNKVAGVAQRLSEGQAFEQIAADLCSHAEAKKTGGISTWVVQDRSSRRVPAQLLTEAFALKEGGVTGPHRSGNTWYVAKVEAMTPAIVSPYEQVKIQISRNLQRQKRLNLYNEYVAKLQAKYPVQIKEAALAALAPPAADPGANLPPMGPVRVSPITFSDPDGPPKNPQPK